MYTLSSDSEFGFRSKKSVDLDTNPVSWLMAEEGNTSAPFGFPQDPQRGYSFEAFPQEMSAEFANGFQDTMYGGTRRPVDAFGFPTELQLPTLVQPEEERFQGSSELSSNRRISNPPSTAQVKNRKAQKKFRERQKAKMVNLSEEVETLRKRVENLSVENRDLENSNMLLNKVIKMRDRQMNILRAKTDSLMQDPKNAANSKLPELLSCSDGEVLSMERSLEVVNHLTANFPASKFANIDQANMRDIWKQYVDLLSGMLMNHESDPDNQDIRQQLKVAVSELGEICLNCATLSPTSMCTLVSTGDTAFTLPVDSDEVQAFWKNVLTSLKMTPHQERLLLERRSRFLQDLETIWKKRTLLSNRLQSLVMSKEDVFKSNVWSCRSHSGVMQVFEELRDTCLNDCQFHTDFIASFFQLVLDDLQTARVFVESFPYYPDVLQIANLVYKKHEEEHQGEPPKTKSQSSSNTSLMTTASFGKE